MNMTNRRNRTLLIENPSSDQLQQLADMLQCPVAVVKEMDKELEMYELIQETLDGLERLQGLTDNEDVAAQILFTGLMSVGFAMGAATKSEYVMSGVEAAATLMGVEVATVGVVVGVAIVVVLCVVIPILYFMQKDAQAVLFVINKTESKYEWKRESIIHGKRVLYTDEVDGSIIFDPNDPSKNRYAGGLYSYAKCDSALIGTQAAFQLQCGDDVFNIGLSEPLNGDSSILLSSGSGQNAVESAANDVGTKKKDNDSRTEDGKSEYYGGIVPPWWYPCMGQGDGRREAIEENGGKKPRLLY
jgi:hypothetical protein